jgi:hypothetical protein
MHYEDGKVREKKAKRAGIKIKTCLADMFVTKYFILRFSYFDPHQSQIHNQFKRNGKL